MSIYTIFPRGDLTALLLAALSSTQVLVGDGEAPATGGWDNDPNDPSSSYVPYVVLMPQTAGEGSGSFGDPDSEWRLPYSLTTYGVSREQAEFYADTARQALVDLARTVVQLGINNWSIQQARVNSIGGVARNDQTEPSEYSQTDVVTIWISKEM